MSDNTQVIITILYSDWNRVKCSVLLSREHLSYKCERFISYIKTQWDCCKTCAYTLASRPLELGVAEGARGAAAAVVHDLVGPHEDTVPRATLEVPGATHRAVVFACDYKIIPSLKEVLAPKVKSKQCFERWSLRLLPNHNHGRFEIRILLDV